MNINQLQSYYLNEIMTGYPDDFLCDLDAQTIQEEFSNLLSVWVANRKDAAKLQTAMSNEIAAIVCRVTRQMDTDPVEYTTDDIRREAEDRAYQAYKDRI